MATDPKTHTIERGGRRWTLQRPGYGGLKRLARRIAQDTDAGMGAPSLAYLDLWGEGSEMEAVLAEYVTDAPEDWIAKTPEGKPRRHDSGRPVLDFEAVDAGEMADVGEEAVMFHRQFRDVDARFGARRVQSA